jgi:NADH-quinone oxidoreductase subunit N
MKLILSSAFSSGVLLFGISLVYGTTGSLDFAGITAAIDGGGLQTLAFVFLFAAFAFKMSAVPFHLWTADVYQGSPMPVTAYLSVISKGATAFVVVNLLHGMFAAMSDAWYRLLMVIVLATLVIGNLFALRQQDIKRFLAFSSIAQVGFILMGMTGNRPLGVSAITYFVLVYVFSNLAAFGVAALVSARTGAEDIPSYRGLAKSNPFLAWMMALALFSLAGIPPTAGFFAKMFLIVEGSWQGDYWFVVAAAINIAVSLYYYMRIVRLMFSDAERPMEAIVPAPSERLGLLVCAAGIVLAGVLSWIYDHISILN